LWAVVYERVKTRRKRRRRRRQRWIKRQQMDQWKKGQDRHLIQLKSKMM